MNPQTLKQILDLQRELETIINSLEPTKADLPPGMFRELTTAEDSLGNALGKLDNRQERKR